MRISRPVFGSALRIVLLLAVALWAVTPALAAQTKAAAPQTEAAAPQGPVSLVGAWALHPLDNESPPPPPPPIYASYKKNEAPLETISRVVFAMDNGKLTGKAAFPKGVVLKDDNRDVTGQPEISLTDIVYDGSALSFKAEVEGASFEGRLAPEGKRGDQFKGTWKAGDKEGKLFLTKRK